MAHDAVNVSQFFSGPYNSYTYGSNNLDHCHKTCDLPNLSIPYVADWQEHQKFQSGKLEAQSARSRCFGVGSGTDWWSVGKPMESKEPHRRRTKTLNCNPLNDLVFVHQALLLTTFTINIYYDRSIYIRIL